MVHKGQAEHVIENVAGCGPFQVTFFMSVVVMVKLSASYCVLLMAFGNYNPGWRCLDNGTSFTFINETGLDTTTTDFGTSVAVASNESTKSHLVKEYKIGSCPDYQQCKDIEFDPETATIVTQWGLVCDRSWIASLIISIQMLGLLLGSYFGGQVSDRIGRKKTVCIGLSVCTVCQLISPFSVSWVMFAALRFLIGMFAISSNMIMLVYMSEFITQKWRAAVMSSPVWAFGIMILTAVAWLTKNWRMVEFVGMGMTAATLIPFLFWAPESLRWLEVNNKEEKFNRVSRQIVKMNKKDTASVQQQLNSVESFTVESKNVNRYGLFSLFRKGYRVITACIIFLNFSMSLLYYAMSFGAKSLYGNFYLNMFLMNVIPLPFNFAGLVLIRTMRRRPFIVSALGVNTVCSAISVVILLTANAATKDFGSTVLICVAKATLDSAWIAVYAICAELYPTVVRGIAIGMASMAARVGGIIAPFVIPKDSSVLYIFVIVMAAMAVVCSFVTLQLPETKDKVLKETFDEDETRDDKYQNEQEL